MKRVFLISLALFHGQLFASLPQVSDLSKGIQLAQLYNRPLILVFTGSDWCSWSQKVCKKLFESEEFSEAIGNNFIFVSLDFPTSVKVDAEKIEAKKQYGVTTFPTLLMLEPDGREVTRLSYSESSSDEFAHSLKQLFSKFALLQEEVARVDLSSIEEKHLESLYKEAVEIRCPSFISELLEKGLELGRGAFFPVEKYSQLILEGKVDTPEAEKLKEEIVSLDRDNHEGARLRLALLDFQSHQDDPDKAAKEPLSYLEEMGKTEDDNLWRLHRLISDYFSEHGRPEEAKEHAVKSAELQRVGSKIPASKGLY